MDSERGQTQPQSRLKEALSPRWVLAIASALDLGVIGVAELRWGPEAFMGGLAFLLAVGLAVLLLVRRRWTVYLATIPLLLAAFITFQLTIRGAKDMGDGIPTLVMNFAGLQANVTLFITGVGLLVAAALDIKSRHEARNIAAGQKT
jgi:hypothetical protein